MSGSFEGLSPAMPISGAASLQCLALEIMDTQRGFIVFLVEGNGRLSQSVEDYHRWPHPDSLLEQEIRLPGGSLSLGRDLVVGTRGFFSCYSTTEFAYIASEKPSMTMVGGDNVYAR